MMKADLSVTANLMADCMPVFQRFALLISFSMFCLAGRAQEGIFDDPAGLFGVAPDAAKPDDAAAEEVDESPLAKQLLEHARRGDLQLADAISSLARTGQWSQVDQLLTQLSQRNVNPATMAEMQQRIGSSLFLRMKRQKELSDNARKALDQLAAAAVAQAESPERLRSAIDQLDSESADVKLAAARVLLGGGNAAVAELVAAAVSENPPAPRDDILRTMVQLGPGGTQALRQLALYASPANSWASCRITRTDRPQSTYRGFADRLARTGFKRRRGCDRDRANFSESVATCRVESRRWNIL